MKVSSSIWNADNWATQGGRLKINWSHSPFISTYKNFDIDANESGLNAESGGVNENGSKWWDMPSYSKLTPLQRRMLRWVHRNYIIYDYCNDSTRFPTSPPECAGLRF
jgi:xyloglucan:xyloglucosyl transferase